MLRARRGLRWPDFSTLSNADVQRVEDKLNSRPRKILGYQTPSEVFLMAA
jgi:IS30 family transposase